MKLASSDNIYDEYRGPCISHLFYDIENETVNKLLNVSFGEKVGFVYNPIGYAKEVHLNFLTKYIRTQKELLFLGLNPGPWGMMQNGVPFGERAAVLEFLKLSGNVERPLAFHHLKPVNGLACKRSEISGKRFWSLASFLGERSADRFFLHSAVYNYFPLGLISPEGKNITPSELDVYILKEIESICDDALLKVLKLLNSKVILALGRFAEKKAKNVLKNGMNNSIKVIYIPHPSPRNPSSNKDWIEVTKTILLENNLLNFFAG